LKEWTTPDSRNTPSTRNLEGEEIVNAPGNDGNASMPEQVKRHNPWRKMMMINFMLQSLIKLAYEYVNWVSLAKDRML
jgi:hypothetical protein